MTQLNSRYDGDWSMYERLVQLGIYIALLAVLYVYIHPPLDDLVSTQVGIALLLGGGFGIGVAKLDSRVDPAVPRWVAPLIGSIAVGVVFLLAWIGVGFAALDSYSTVPLFAFFVGYLLVQGGRTTIDALTGGEETE